MTDCLFCETSCACLRGSDGQVTLANCECCDLPIADCLNRLEVEPDVPDGFLEFRIPRLELRRDEAAA